MTRSWWCIKYARTTVAESAELRLIEPLNDSGQFVGTSWPEYLDLRERLQTMPNVIASRTFPAYIGEPGSVERVFGSLVSDNYFSALRVHAVLGRTFQASDLTADDHIPVVVISTGLWKSRFGGASDVVGQTMRVNSQPMTIVGVVPDEFQGTHFGLNFDPRHERTHHRVGPHTPGGAAGPTADVCDRTGYFARADAAALACRVWQHGDAHSRAHDKPLP